MPEPLCDIPAAIERTACFEGHMALTASPSCSFPDLNVKCHVGATKSTMYTANRPMWQSLTLARIASPTFRLLGCSYYSTRHLTRMMGLQRARVAAAVPYGTTLDFATRVTMLGAPRHSMLDRIYGIMRHVDRCAFTNLLYPIDLS